MKQIYMKPETLVMEVELQQMIALSKGGEADPNGEVLSRESDWDDEY